MQSLAVGKSWRLIHAQTTETKKQMCDFTSQSTQVLSNMSLFSLIKAERWDIPAADHCLCFPSTHFPLATRKRLWRACVKHSLPHYNVLDHITVIMEGLIGSVFLSLIMREKQRKQWTSLCIVYNLETYWWNISTDKTDQPLCHVLYNLVWQLLSELTHFYLCHIRFYTFHHPKNEI